MADFTPPHGPPPPRVPEGWIAKWDANYNEWFYVNLKTKKSTWDKPTEPATSDDAPPGYAPPSGNVPAPSDTKGSLHSNNPYSHPGDGNPNETDAQLAARLQAEEDARASGHSGDRGASDSYYGSGQQQGGGGYPSAPSGYSSGQLPARPDSGDPGKSRGFLGKLLGKSSSNQPQQQYGGYPQQQYQQGYPQQQYQQGPMGYGQGYGQQQGYPPQGYYQQPMYGQQPPRRSGLGAGGGAALGLGGGLLGGMMLGEAMDGGDGGGDYGGGGDDGGGGDGGGGGD